MYRMAQQRVQETVIEAQVQHGVHPAVALHHITSRTHQAIRYHWIFCVPKQYKETKKKCYLHMKQLKERFIVIFFIVTDAQQCS